MYPYEWCFSELKDAALLTLDVQERALHHGMSLKDASAYNLQFRRARPVFMDTLSFERDDGGPWIAYEQFCRHFLAPLLLMADRSPGFNQYLRLDLDGFPLRLSSRLLGWKTMFRPGALIHVHLHSRALGRTGRDRAALRSRPEMKRRLAASLRRTVDRIRLPDTRTQWSDYERAAAHYPREAAAVKKRFVESVLERDRPSLVYDCGGNSGGFARLAALHGSRCVLFDADPMCVESAYLAEKASGSGLVLPLLMDLGNPTPALGFSVTERLSLFERPRADLVLALALLHHMSIGQNVPFDFLARFFRRLGRRLIVEFVEPDDPLAAAMIRRKGLHPDDYSYELFLDAFRREFRVSDWKPIPGMKRRLLLLEGAE